MACVVAPSPCAAATDDSLEPVARHDRLLDEVAEVLERELALAALARRREGHGLELALEVLVELGLDFVEPVAPARDPCYLRRLAIEGWRPPAIVDVCVLGTTRSAQVPRGGVWRRASPGSVYIT